MTPQNFNYQRNDRNNQNQTVLTLQQIRNIIQYGGKELVDTAEKLGPMLYNQHLTTSQIRNIYGAVKQMEINGFKPNEFILLKPKLAYAAVRANGNGAKILKDVLTMAIDEVGEDKARFGRFVDFFEAILAYHKAEGGK